MTSAARRSPVVRNRPGQWIRDRIEHQRDAHGQPGIGPGQRQHLVVVEKQEDPEGAVLDSFGSLSESVSEFDRQTERWRNATAACRADSRAVTGVVNVLFSTVHPLTINAKPSSAAM